MLASIVARTASGVGEAARLYVAATKLAQATGGGYPQVTALLGLADLELGRANLSAASAHATRALELAGQADYRLLKAHAHTLLAEIQLCSGDRDAHLAAEEALAIHRDTGHLLGQARALLVLARALPAEAATFSARAGDILAKLGIAESTMCRNP
jgi:hypothetical protein